MKSQRIFAICVLSLGLWACQTQGPAERFGKRVDTATGNDHRTAQQAGRNVDDAVDDVREARKDLKK
ncbi:MAG: hypothetical protein ABI640_05270 [Gammaproteobacteria bacterium]